MQAKKPLISLFKTAQGWMARFGGEDGAKFVKLFGTNILPLPFTAEAEPVQVLGTFQKLHPEADVWLEREVR